MRNLIIFIRRFFNFFLFLILLILCLSLVFNHNYYQRVSFLSSTNKVSGYLFGKYNNFEYYFHLKAVNDSLATQNAQLLNQLPEDFASPDSSSRIIKDSAGKRQYLYMSARVVNNSVNSLSNYITLYRGMDEGVEAGMGVVGPQGIVGIVRKASKHYAVVMSMLHKDTRISAQLKNTGNFGSVKWDISGLNPDEGILTDIPKNVPVHKGDSVVTSGFSAIFPQGLLIGYVNKISEVSSSNFHSIGIRFATRFQELQYVYVIKNFNAKEQHDLESSVPHE